MAITRLLTPIHYQGISSDIKPENSITTTPYPVPEGSTFHEVDTGKEYVFYNGTWEPDNRRIYAFRMALNS